MKSSERVFTQSVVFNRSRKLTSSRFFSIFAVLLALFSLTSAKPAAACPVLKWGGDTMVPPNPAAGTSAQVTYTLTTDSSCDANGYSLAFHSVMPASAECLQGNYSGSNPAFTISAGATGQAVANIPAAPPETVGCLVRFDILDASGTPLPVLPGGRLHKIFGAGAGPGGPCFGATPPVIQGARLSHLGNGQVLVSAGVTAGAAAPTGTEPTAATTPTDPTTPAASVLTVTLELNGESIPMELLASGEYGAQGISRGRMTTALPPLTAALSRSFPLLTG